ncbi:MAG: formylglycine-generating enzyme family protein [Pirellulales bacterium]|nr:formylglycine-generating enzyme family protein [Pirellulales bacterium]
MQNSLLSGSTRFTCWLIALLGVLVMLIASSRAKGSTFWLSAGVGAVAIVLAGARLFAHRGRDEAPSCEPSRSRTSECVDVEVDEELPSLGATGDIVSLVDQMLSRGRYALLLRPQIAQSLSGELYSRASDVLDREMGVVPAGEVQLEPSVFDIDYLLFAQDEAEDLRSLIIPVQSVFLDRHSVTNKQFQRFVSAGGYQEMAIWDQEIWPAVLDFVDRTGHPGPRFWKNGRFPPGEANLPVVGVSWYEAAAYSRWVGKRLPTDAEWVKAGSWPVTLSHNTRLQRKYPWGDTMDRSKANVWGAGPGRVVAVDEFAEGVSVGGLNQLVGNVWEWTACNLDLDPTVEETGRSERTLLKSIRGGAFDTYFENQANCQFASGENPISRKHNIGFRCALSVCDIAGPPAAGVNAGSVPTPVHEHTVAVEIHQEIEEEALV